MVEYMIIDQWEARPGRGDINIPGPRFITPVPCLAARDNKISKLVDAEIAMRARKKGRHNWAKGKWSRGIYIIIV